MTTQELLAQVRRIEIKTRSISRHLFSGEYHSAFKGRGMSFSEVRDYQYGDDVRNIDWNVTARTGDPHVKVFEEERELTVMLLVDVSGSTYFGTRTQSKRHLQTLLSAVLGFSAGNNNDKVGVLFFSDKIEKFLPPKKGRSHMLRIIRELLDLEPTGVGTDLGAALDYLNNLVKKRSICFVLSDFQTDNYLDALRQTARRHDLIGIQTYDPAERELPKVGLIPFHHPETDQTGWLDTDSSRVRYEYRDRFDRFTRDFEQQFQRSGARTLRVRTDEDYVGALLRFFRG